MNILDQIGAFIQRVGASVEQIAHAAFYEVGGPDWRDDLLRGGIVAALFFILLTFLLTLILLAHREPK